MAFTADQIVNIKFALGYPLIGYRDLYPGVDFTIAQYGDDVAASAFIVSLLARLATIQTQLDACNSSAGIKKVDEVEFQSSNGVSQTALSLRSAGRLIVSQISSAMAIPVAADIFSSSGNAIPVMGIV